MDIEQLKYLTSDQKDRYVTLERTFDTKGWGYIVAWAQKHALQQLERAALAGNWEDHRLATGARLAFEQIAALREVTENEFVMLAEQQMLNDEAEDELEHE